MLVRFICGNRPWVSNVSDNKSYFCVYNDSNILECENDTEIVMCGDSGDNINYGNDSNIVDLKEEPLKKPGTFEFSDRK